jgi:2'-5' RNA ligase
MRLFLAIDLPLNIRNVLQTYQPQNSNLIQIVDKNQLHLTLHFIGESEFSKIDTMISKVKFKEFRICMNNVGCFKGRGKSKILWAGVQNSEALDKLHFETGQMIRKCGINLDSRRYSPHITLARCKQGYNQKNLNAFLNNKSKLIKFDINYFALYCSEFLKGKPQYNQLKKYFSI